MEDSRISELDCLACLIISAIFYVREISPAIQMAIQNVWMSQPLIYPIKKVETRSFSILPNIPNIKIDIGNGNDSHLPKFLAIMFVENMSYVGSYTKNPFNFQHFNVADVVVDVSGNPICPRMVFDFDKNIFIREYESLFNSKKLSEHGNHISKEDYPKGNTIICFDMTPDSTDGCNFDFRRTKLKYHTLQLL